MAAATVLPPFLPFATIYGTSTVMIRSFACTTLTNPTGTPITRAGCTHPSRISSSMAISAVGAFPTEKMICFPVFCAMSAAFFILAAALVVPSLFASSATSGSAI